MTPVVLQKVQPIVAVIAAGSFSVSASRPRFALYLGPALVGAWLIGVPDPLHPTVHGLKPMLYALGAAVLWALGTVLGRYLARMMRFEHVTTLRFLFGLPASAIALLVLGAPAFASGARHVLDRGARARHGARRAQPLLLRPAAHAGGRRDARGARLPGQRDPRRVLQVRRRRSPAGNGSASALTSARRRAAARAAGRDVSRSLPRRTARRDHASATSARATGCRTSRTCSRPRVRAELVSRLAAAGLPRIEAVSFVRDERVPQMAGAEEVVAAAEPRAAPSCRASC